MICTSQSSVLRRTVAADMVDTGLLATGVRAVRRAMADRMERPAMAEVEGMLRAVAEVTSAAEVEDTPAVEVAVIAQVEAEAATEAGDTARAYELQSSK